ncbi:MAG: potassium channel protein [Acidobacteriota bacterium]|nr:MAG: potassium channel protein [Acidobacteriota bacterium]
MKNFTSMLLALVGQGATKRNIRVLIRFLLVLIGLITVYSIIFHFIMEWEGQRYSWITGFYWTLTVMSTLGFGDITFQTDLGRIFSIVVLLSGMLFMLTLLPFTFIQFFYAPWMEAQTAARVQRALPEDTKDHVILTHDDEVARTLIRMLQKYQYPYVLLVNDMGKALAPQDEDINMVFGDLDDPATYRSVRLENASLLAATGSDIANTAVISAARGVDEDVEILATVKDKDSIDILTLAGANRVLRLGEMMGEALSRRLMAGGAVSQVVGAFDELLIAEAPAAETDLVGKTVRESGLREKANVNIVGLWERGVFAPADPDTTITRNTVLLLAGSRDQLDEFDHLFPGSDDPQSPIVILGGGRVGRATGRGLARRGLDYRIVEKVPEMVPDDPHYVLGSAADIDVLNKAGIMECPAVVITTHDDDLNVYLTIYCRKLRPDIQIITRATREKIVGTLHHAGADYVMSYASMGANTIFNLLKRSDVLMVTEGLSLFRIEVPEDLAGKSVGDCAIRESTGCTIVAVQKNGLMEINPGPGITLDPTGEIVLIGGVEAEKEFLETFT